MIMPTLLSAAMRAAVLTALSVSAACATDLVYAPVNPTFGGNPNNGPMLLNDAQAQNGYKAPTLTPLQNFNNNLQQAILSRLLTQATSKIFPTGNTLTAGTYDTGTYLVAISNPDAVTGNVTITTTDKTSGASVVFVVGPNSVQ